MGAGNWNTESTETLPAHHADGVSASIIGRRMGLSRNAVLGKLWRLGLEGRHDRMVRLPKSNGTRHASKPLPEPVRAPKAPLSLALDLMAVNDSTCRWPDPSDRDYTFCGHPVLAGSNYCPFHRSIASSPAKAKP